MRVDLPQYRQGCETLQNMLVRPAGGAIRRPGTQFVKEAQGGNPAKLIPFTSSESESYVVELTTGAIRVINTIDGTVTTPTITSPATAFIFSQIFSVQYFQVGDVLYMVQGSHIPVRLFRTGTNAFTYQNFDTVFSTSTALYATQWPYLDPNPDTSITITPSGTSGSVTLTATASIFNNLHVGALFKIAQGTTTGVAQVTSFTSATVVHATVIIAFGATTASSNWQESAWSNFRGWPAAIGYDTGRIYYANTPFEPDSFYGTRTNDFNFLMPNRLAQDSINDASGINFFGDPNNDDPIYRTFASPRVNEIEWISSHRALTMGTFGSENLLYPLDSSQLFGPQNINNREQSYHGSVAVTPAHVDNALVFIDRTGQGVREFLYNLQQDNYTADSLSTLAEHMTSKALGYQAAQIREIAWSETDFVLWCVDSNAGFFGTTRDRNQSVNAWHSHVIGGVLSPLGDFSDTRAPAVESVCIVPNGPHDDIWISVVRTINNANVCYVEKIQSPFKYNTLNDPLALAGDAPIYLDAAFVYDGTATSTVTGVNHLIGQTVAVLADGFLQSSKVVANDGSVTLDRAASHVVIGLDNTWIVKPMPIEAGSAIGSAQGSVGRIDRAMIQFYRTCAAKVGSSMNYGEYEELNFRGNDQANNQPTNIFTGEKVIDFPSSPERERPVYIFGSGPFPAGIVGMTFRGDMRDD